MYVFKCDITVSHIYIENLTKLTNSFTKFSLPVTFYTNVQIKTSQGCEIISQWSVIRTHQTSQSNHVGWLISFNYLPLDTLQSVNKGDRKRTYFMSHLVTFDTVILTGLITNPSLMINQARSNKTLLV